MSVKVIQITIPNDRSMPDIISTFSPEENYLMLKIGSDTLREGRKVVTSLTSDEVYKKIENDFKKEIESLDSEIELEKLTSVKMQEKITQMYETQIEQLNKKLENAMVQLKTYEKDMSTSLQEEISKVKEKYDLLLEEKDRQNQLNREAFDKATNLINKTINKSSISLGDSGEQIFENLTDTFKDFVNFKIENKAKQGHKGDFHLFFKDFNILVDSKNYTSSVSKKEIQKIESDLNTNGNMNFAWLVSLNTNICDYNKFPITSKWITSDDGKQKCILMINNLLDNKEPRNILRQAWQICDIIYRLTRNIKSEDGELEKIRDNILIYKKQINNLQERAYDLRRSMNTSLNILKNMDNDLLDMLSNMSDEIVNEKFGALEKLKEWWNNTIEYTDNDENKIISTEIWNKFKKENKEYIRDNKITIEYFKDIITSHIVKTSNYIEKTKKGAVEFIGFKWKEEKNKEKKEEKNKEKEEEKFIDNLELNNIIVEKINNVKKVKNTEFYFNKEIDNKILNEYENELNDIMSMSSINIRPWEIVSLLMRYKIIKKRDEARGYDKYKETEEYKSKLNSK
jgi:hypothetical protein